MLAIDIVRDFVDEILIFLSSEFYLVDFNFNLLSIQNE